jgi:hypothetical protein
MDINQARTEAIQEEIIAQMDAHQERMGASVNAWRKEMMACQEVMEAYLESKEPTPEEMKSVAVHEVVPKEEAEVETSGAVWGPASSCKALRSAEETDPGQWWFPEEVGHYPRMVDLPCHSCTVEGTWSTWTRQGQCCTRNSERTDILEEVFGATIMQQQHKEPRPKEVIMSGKQGKC